MPNIGDVARARDVGVNAGSHKCIWHACEACGAERWVIQRRGKPQSRLCYPCGRTHAGEVRKANPARGKDHPRWKGGRHVTVGGYIQIWVEPDDPYRPMADKRGRVFEHRLVMARHLGRCLRKDEDVHHRNGNKHDNSLGNLQLMTHSDHSAEPYRRIAELEREVIELRARLARYEQTEAT